MATVHRMRLRVDDSSLLPVLDAIRAELDLPAAFPVEVDEQVAGVRGEWERFLRLVSPRFGAEAEDPGWGLPPLEGAREAAGLPWSLLVPEALPLLDASAIPFVTIDPESSRDLDQAIRLRRLPGGREDGARYLVDYAIASLATFIRPGSPLDLDVRRRGLTVYLPDRSTPLHPLGLSEGAASLLPGQPAPACVWRILLDEEGRVVSRTLLRALACSRAKLSYEQVEASRLSGRPLPGAPSDLVELLGEIGEKRRALETKRGGVSSPTPEQEILRVADSAGSSHYELEFRRQSPVEEWNAQISLLAGMSAASIMREAGLGILRTVPPAGREALLALRAFARLVGVEWPEGEPYSALVPRLDPSRPADLSFLAQAMSLYRGAAYTVFADDPSRWPEPEGIRPFPALGDPASQHAAIATEYAHTTAPLRRLVDRWCLEICLAHEAGAPIPAWIRESLAGVPALMAEAGRRASAAERGAIGAVSAKLLSGHEGEAFTGVIVERRESAREGEKGRVVLAEPAVQGSVTAADRAALLPLGEQTRVVLALSDVSARKVRFTWEPRDPGEAVPLR